MFSFLLSAICFGKSEKLFGMDGVDCSQAVARTIAHYNGAAAEYADRHSGVSPNVAKVREVFAAQIPTAGRVLELGAAHGRDTAEFKRLGFRVTPVEPSDELAQILERKLRIRVIRVTAQAMVFDGGFDGVYAMAVLHHIPVEELRVVFQKIVRALKPGGFAHTSFAMGVGTPDVAEFDSKGRFWSRVSEKTLRGILAEIPEIEIDENLTEYQADDYHGKRAPTSTFGFFNLYFRRKN